MNIKMLFPKTFFAAVKISALTPELASDEKSELASNEKRLIIRLHNYLLIVLNRVGSTIRMCHDGEV